MANPEHLAKLKEGVVAWNQWRKENNAEPDLSGADLFEANLADADLVDADFRGADLRSADLSRARFMKADLRGANLTQADLIGADFRGADLSEAKLSAANLIGTIFERANLTGCHVHGASVWNTQLEGAIQSNLVITLPSEPVIQVDHLEVAQFVYLLLNNEKIRQVIDTITSKVVLILGRFTPERKTVLDAIRDELRKRGYLPILFDFQKPDNKDLTGTIKTLANMARFIIADLTDPSSIPYELGRIVPDTKIAVQAIIRDGQPEFAMFHDLLDYRWVLAPYRYQSQDALLANLDQHVIAPAEAKVKELRDG